LSSGVTAVTRAVLGTMRTTPRPRRAPSRVGVSIWSLTTHTAPSPMASWVPKPAASGNKLNAATGRPIRVTRPLVACTRSSCRPLLSNAHTTPRPATRAAGQLGSLIRADSASVRGFILIRRPGPPSRAAVHDHSPSDAAACTGTRTLPATRPVLASTRTVRSPASTHSASAPDTNLAP
jgi:hypothetical protein